MIRFSGYFAAAGGLMLLVSAAQAADDGKSYLFGEVYAVKNADRAKVPMSTGEGARVGFGADLSPDFGYEFGVFGNIMAAKSPFHDGHQEGAVLDLYKYLGPSIYVMTGIGYVRDSLVAVSNSPAIEVGLGLKKPLSDRWRFRMSLEAQDDFDNDADPAKSSYIDYRLNFGLDWMRASPRPPPPPPADTDHDGLPDWQDLCPQQAAATVDGCPPPPPPPPPDSDSDGVPDTADKCPTVAASTPDGCPPPPPPDTDKDGVLDSTDACPGTLEGLKVDERGCVIQNTKQTTVLKGVSFLPSSSELQPDAMTILDLTVAALQGQPGLRLEIDGYTDTSGNKEVNIRLSKERAQAVRKYFISKGIDGSRLTAKGLGPANPIADNKEAWGRVLNRRVELKVLQ